MKKILVPVDFSGHSAISCQYALAMVSPSGGDICLFHTYFDQIMIPDSTYPESIDMSPVYNEGLLMDVIQQSRKKMSSLCEKLEEDINTQHLNGITIHDTITGGEIEQELRDICRDYHPSLVIMGTRGLGNTLNLLGNVSTYIINHAKVPVLTVPESMPFRRFRNIMLAADLSGWNAGCIHAIMDTFGEFDIRIHCVHVNIPGKEKDESQKMQALFDQVKETVPPGRLLSEGIEISDDSQTSIDRYVHEHEIDMIAYQPLRRSFFYNLFSRKITQKNLFAAKLPLLAIPAPSN